MLQVLTAMSSIQSLCPLSPVVIHSLLASQEGSAKRSFYCSEYVCWGNEGKEEKDRGHRVSWYPGEASPFSDKERGSGGRGCKRAPGGGGFDHDVR